MVKDEWVLVWVRDGGDYYAGETAALYRNGERVWRGSSYDAAEDIVRAIVGDDLEVRTVGRDADLPPSSSSIEKETT